jgi:dTDP-4-amino-4,6-dideoxygalactose transaminase
MSDVSWSVPLSDVLVDDELVEAAGSVVRSGWWSMGPRVEEFERAFADFCGARHAVAVSSGTTALHLALLACGCERGDEVVLPSLNFVAAANSIAHTGATPVFCDIRGEDDLNLDPEDLESVVTSRTKALLVLHYGGHPCEMAPILKIARARGLAVIEDAAHAPGATWRGRACGTLGSIGCFSFFSNKNLPIGEGGAVVTDDDELADTVRLLRSHGMTTLTWDRHRGHAHTYDVVAQGFNYRLDELRAAMGLVQLRRLSAANLARARLVARYRSLLHGLEGAIMPFADASEASAAHHLAVAVLPPGTPRDSVREALREKGIQTSVHYPPIHRFSVYQEANSSRPLPCTEDVAERLITLPLFPHMTEAQVDLVAAELGRALAARGRPTARRKTPLRETDKVEGIPADLAAPTAENLPE